MFHVTEDSLLSRETITKPGLKTAASEVEGSIQLIVAIGGGQYWQSRQCRGNPSRYVYKVTHIVGLKRTSKRHTFPLGLQFPRVAVTAEVVVSGGGRDATPARYLADISFTGGVAIVHRISGVDDRATVNRSAAVRTEPL